MYYKYKVTYWSEFEEKDKCDEGLVFGNNYGNAADHLRQDYGDNLIDMYLQELDLEHTVTVDDWNDIFH